jgi:hypothetical protein
VNLVAAETLPADMPAFLHTQEAISEISIQFTAQRMGAGAAMLRDMIYSAWLESANLNAPPYPTKPQ